jgi:hypothetical protein
MLSGFELGLLISFNVELLKHGIKRVINEQLRFFFLCANLSDLCG